MTQLEMVSIHAPVKVRRILNDILSDIDFVSIHAPVKVRLVGHGRFGETWGFNSRTREGATLKLY